ncbi:MAG: hypothetical protein A2V66_03910 [Ignavibacteria bacterium RBG_13_36_8]|nr:MAG: hypothetical protein A2V66_03910 [Ignavibacteria bacterium RBG_13_36_8]
MDEKVIHEMMSAFAAGCMDKENYINFKNYIDSQGELPYRELGELQNLTAMVPLILELELPDIKLKDRIAKKLIGMQDEIKAKIKERKTKTRSTKEKAVIPPETELPHKAKITKDILTETFERTTDKKQKTLSKEKKKEPKRFSHLLLWIGFILIAVLLGGLSYYFYNSSKSLNTEILNLKNEVTSLQEEILSNKDFLSNYNSLIEFFSYKDIAVIDLIPAEENSPSSGKLFITYAQLKGLLEMNNIPALPTEQVYQLWIVTNGVSYSIGTFSPSVKERYFEIQQMPYISKEDLELVRLTIEPRDGSPTPQGQTFLYGVVVQPRTRRR